MELEENRLEKETEMGELREFGAKRSELRINLSRRSMTDLIPCRLVRPTPDAQFDLVRYHSVPVQLHWMRLPWLMPI